MFSRELTSTFSRLTQRVDLSEAELEGNIRQLSFRIQRLENIQRRSKAFRSEVMMSLRGAGSDCQDDVTEGGGVRLSGASPGDSGSELLVYFSLEMKPG